MTGAAIVLALAYAAVAALLLNLNLATSHAAWIKGSAIVLVTGLYAGGWYGVHGMLGWASPDQMPETFRVLWITIDEPEKSGDVPGAIYFWVRRLDAAGLPVGEPRAHRVAWTEEAAEAAQEALAQMEEGEQLNGRMGRRMLEESAPEDAVDYAGDGSVAGDGGRLPDFELVRAPPPALPAKSNLEIR